MRTRKRLRRHKNLSHFVISVFLSVSISFYSSPIAFGGEPVDPALNVATPTVAVSEVAIPESSPSPSPLLPPSGGEGKGEGGLLLSGVQTKIQTTDEFLQEGGVTLEAVQGEPPPTFNLLFATVADQPANLFVEVVDGQATVTWDGKVQQGVFDSDTNQIVIEIPGTGGPLDSERWILSFEKTDPLPGDFNSDWQVDAMDLAFVRVNFGVTTTANDLALVRTNLGRSDTPYHLSSLERVFDYSREEFSPLPGDFNRDHTVDATDLAYVRSNFGITTSAGDLAIVRSNLGRSASLLRTTSISVSQLIRNGTSSSSGRYTVSDWSAKQKISVNAQDIGWDLITAGIWPDDRVTDELIWMIDQEAQVRTVEFYTDSNLSQGTLDFTIDYTKDSAGYLTPRRVTQANGAVSLVQGDADVLSSETDDLLLQNSQGVSDYTVSYGGAFEDGRYLGYGLIFSRWDAQLAEQVQVVVDYPNHSVAQLDGGYFKVNISSSGLVSLTLVSLAAMREEAAEILSFATQQASALQNSINGLIATIQSLPSVESAQGAYQMIYVYHQVIRDLVADSTELSLIALLNAAQLREQEANQALSAFGFGTDPGFIPRDLESELNDLEALIQAIVTDVTTANDALQAATDIEAAYNLFTELGSQREKLDPALTGTSSSQTNVHGVFNDINGEAQARADAQGTLDALATQAASDVDDAIAQTNANGGTVNQTAVSDLIQQYTQWREDLERQLAEEKRQSDEIRERLQNEIAPYLAFIRKHLDALSGGSGVGYNEQVYRDRGNLEPPTTLMDTLGRESDRIGSRLQELQNTLAWIRESYAQAQVAIMTLSLDSRVPDGVDFSEPLAKIEAAWEALITGYESLIQELETVKTELDAIKQRLEVAYNDYRQKVADAEALFFERTQNLQKGGNFAWGTAGQVQTEDVLNRNQVNWVNNEPVHNQDSIKYADELKIRNTTVANALTSLLGVFETELSALDAWLTVNVFGDYAAAKRARFEAECAIGIWYASQRGVIGEQAANLINGILSGALPPDAGEIRSVMDEHNNTIANEFVRAVGAYAYVAYNVRKGRAEADRHERYFEIDKETNNEWKRIYGEFRTAFKSAIEREERTTRITPSNDITNTLWWSRNVVSLVSGSWKVTGYDEVHYTVHIRSWGSGYPPEGQDGSDLASDFDPSHASINHEDGDNWQLISLFEQGYGDHLWEKMHSGPDYNWSHRLPPDPNDPYSPARTAFLTISGGNTTEYYNLAKNLKLVDENNANRAYYTVVGGTHIPLKEFPEPPPPGFGDGQDYYAEGLWWIAPDTENAPPPFVGEANEHYNDVVDPLTEEFFNLVGYPGFPPP